MALAEAEAWVPADTFGARLALVRQHMGWNVKEAADACGIGHQSWRNWEEGGGCRRMEAMAKLIASRTGCDYRWLMAGGPLIRWKADAGFLTSLDMPSGQMHLPLDTQPELELVGPPS